MKKIITICLLVPPIYLFLPIEFLFEQKVSETRYFDAKNGSAAPLQPAALPSRGVQEAWVRHYSSGLAPSFDVTADIAVDSSGNVYVTGYSSNLVSGADYFTIKYDTRGNQVWTARYNGAANQDDLTAAISVDKMGNVYVTGTSIESGSSSDFTTIKYNRDGVQEWVVRYNGPANSKDETAALAVDESGNIYVTGRSEGIGAWYDFATVKYNSKGEEQWVARYAGPANSYDNAIALAVARSGNIYVTGWSLNFGVGPSHYVTIKYSPTGVEQWIARYNGVGQSENQASAIAIDRVENVYVIGWSEGINTDWDYATVKYNSEGKVQWIARYNGPGNAKDRANALTLDMAGNLYVTGYSVGSGINHDADYATIKYDSAGNEKWIARYNGPANVGDLARDVVVDRSGNVIVTGSSHGLRSSYDFTTIKYNSDGIEQWIADYNVTGDNFGDKNDVALALVIDRSDNIYVTGSSLGYGTDYDNDYETVKYNSSGQQQWAAHLNNQGNSKDDATAMTVDDAGNVYVTGWSLASGASRDYLTIKYNATGEVQWIARYNGPGNSTDEATAIAVDRAGNVYVTGQSVGSGTGYDYATIKYNSSGMEQWAARYNGPSNSYDGGKALVLDAAGNIYMTGGITIKYDNFGAVQWVGPHDDFVQATAIALDPFGNVYVRSGYAAVVIKFNQAGVKQWAKRTDHYLATGFAVDDSSNIYVTGWTEPGHGTSFYITLKLNSDGVQQWIVQEQVAPGDNMAAALAVDRTGNVYVTGRSQTSYATIKYNNAGVRQWVARYYGPANSLNQATALAVDNDSNVYVTGYSGYSNGFQPAFDYATIKYNTDGVEQWAIRFNGPQNPFDHPNAILVDGSGNVFVTGSCRYSEAVVGRDKSIYTTIKYIQNPVAVEDDKKLTPKSYYLSQNYPNPFNPLTKICYALPKANRVILKIYNQLGHEMATLVNEIKAAGEYETPWNAEGFPSGVYIYRLQAGEFVESKKLILLR